MSTSESITLAEVVKVHVLACATVSILAVLLLTLFTHLTVIERWTRRGNTVRELGNPRPPPLLR
jgi:hypothetical protein